MPLWQWLARWTGGRDSGRLRMAATEGQQAPGPSGGGRRGAPPLAGRGQHQATHRYLQRCGPGPRWAGTAKYRSCWPGRRLGGPLANESDGRISSLLVLVVKLCHQAG